jgi:uncharacterized protein (TIGR03000 family)
MKTRISLVALGLVALFWTPPAPAAAPRVGGIAGIGRVAGIGRIGWRGYGLSGWYWTPRFHYRAWRTGYYYPDAGASYYYPYTAYYPDAGVSYSYTAYYPQEQGDAVNKVTLRMHVPSDARVWLEGEATSQGGADRSFLSPSLEPGREYVYHIRVQWDENGKTMERNRDVPVHAGDRINLQFDK